MVDDKGRYLCICSLNDDGISNVGVFDADSKDEAREFARRDWGYSSVRGIYAFPMTSLQDGWSWYR